jgi:hypothetical protein
VECVAREQIILPSDCWTGQPNGAATVSLGKNRENRDWLAV